jgi:hypothetical protein
VVQNGSSCRAQSVQNAAIAVAHTYYCCCWSCVLCMCSPLRVCVGWVQANAAAADDLHRLRCELVYMHDREEKLKQEVSEAKQELQVRICSTPICGLSRMLPCQPLPSRRHSAAW